MRLIMCGWVKKKKGEKLGESLGLGVGLLVAS